MIHAMVAGTLGRDAELRYTPGGDAVLAFSVATRRYDSKAKEEVTDWVSVSYFGKRAEGVSKHLVKGSRVAIRGGLHVRVYEHNGQTKHSVELRADDVELLGKPQDRVDPMAPTERPARAKQAAFGDDGGEIPF
jgi:single-strand DNA-binding protein